MRGRTQFWLGSVALALAVGMLAGGLVWPRAAVGQDDEAVGGSHRYAVVTGLAGSARRSQTIYVIDDRHDALYILEYNASSHEFDAREMTDIKRHAQEIIKERAKRKGR